MAKRTFDELMAEARVREAAGDCGKACKAYREAIELLMPPVAIGKPVTDRGFRRFAEQGELRVQESSIAFKGAHVWVFAHGNAGQPADAHLNVEEAKVVVYGLRLFIAEAEAGELCESVKLEEETDAEE